MSSTSSAAAVRGRKAAISRAKPADIASKLVKPEVIPGGAQPTLKPKNLTVDINKARKAKVPKEKERVATPVPLRSKLAAPSADTRPKWVAPVIRTVPDLKFIGNFIRTYDGGKCGFEIDDDTYAELSAIGNGFSTSVEFKSPVKAGIGNSAGRYFINTGLDKEFPFDEAVRFKDNQIIVHGFAKTYGPFTGEDGKQVQGWSFIATDFSFGAVPDITAEEEGDDEMENEEQE